MNEDRFEQLKRDSKKAGRDAEFAHKAQQEKNAQPDVYEAYLEAMCAPYTGYAARVAKAAA